MCSIMPNIRAGGEISIAEFRPCSRSYGDNCDATQGPLRAADLMNENGHSMRDLRSYLIVRFRLNAEWRLD